MAGCTTFQEFNYSAPWNYVDVRSLDPADASSASTDLVAIYSRMIGDEIQFRMDWLSHSLIQNYDLYLALDTRKGGTRQLPFKKSADINWDLLLVVPASGPVQALDSNLTPLHDLEISIFRNSTLDSVIVSFSRKNIVSPLSGWIARYIPVSGGKAQVFLTSANRSEEVDRSSAFFLYGDPPSPANVLFVFWDTFPAYTPAQALRRWDGAHTGPYGGRHGLYNLLKVAGGSQPFENLDETMASDKGIPLVLMDLKWPASLSALDALGGLELVRQMSESGLLILPEYLPDFPKMAPKLDEQYQAKILQDQIETAKRMGLPHNRIISMPFDEYPETTPADVIFSRVEITGASKSGLEPTELLSWEGKPIIPVIIQPDSSVQATISGPSDDLRLALIKTAIDSQKQNKGSLNLVLVLGGDLPASTWGDPQIARPSLHYLLSRPWIHFMDEHELLTLKPSVRNSDQGLPEWQSPPGMLQAGENFELLEKLLNAPDNPIGQAAWQTYEALAAPTYPRSKTLPELREDYIGLVEVLLSASAWAETPYSEESCSVDPDADGQPECILANENIFTIFEIPGGTLEFAFYRETSDSSQVTYHQVIAPSSEFITGTSDPSTWNLGLGMASDPSVITGAFAEAGKNYRPEISNEKLVFTSNDMSRIKEYRLQKSGIIFEYRMISSPGHINLLLPITLDPWERFDQGWVQEYRNFTESNKIMVGLDTGFNVQISSNANLFNQAFSDSLPLLNAPENPNLDYPPGHFLPYPLFLMSVESDVDLTVEIIFQPHP